MNQLTEFQGKHILVLGFAKSGYAAARVLNKLGALVTVNDFSSLSEDAHAKELEGLGVKIVDNGHPLSIQQGNFDLVVKNPGIPYSNPVVQAMQQRNIPIWTEVELAYRLTGSTIIGITGSNGKTTTTTILNHLFNIDHKQAWIAGNIGTVATEVAQEASDEDTIIMELSSFQLLGIDQFRPHIAIITNIYEAHLDYHGSREAYVAAKGNLLKNQTADDYVIYNADQQDVVDLVASTKAKRIPFSTEEPVVDGIYADDTFIYWLGRPLLPIEVIKLPGKHNLENILCATAAACIEGVAIETIEKVLSSFAGVKHRMQFVIEREQVKFYNDSKATNTLATKSALQSFGQSPIVLIAGGLDRKHSFDDLTPYLKHVKALFTFGETGERLAAFGSHYQIPIVQSFEHLEEAVDQAKACAEPADVVLFSPACASWDQYKDFEERGDAFISAVLN